MQNDIPVPSDWYETFFTAPVNRFWEKMVPPEATAADLAFLLRHLALPAGASILDVPCGAGRHALALARLGHRVTGVDLSEDAIARARAQAESEGLDARFVRADMRDLPAGGAFDAVACLGNSVGYFPAAETAAFLGALASRLRPRGRLVLDCSTCAESLFPLQDERTIEFAGGAYEARMAYDPRRSLLKTEARLTLAGETHDLRYAHHIVTSGTLVGWLETAGLSVLDLYGDTEDTPFVPGSKRLVVVAARGSD